MLFIDASMLAHRTFAKMDFLKNSKGTRTGMEFGFLRSIESLEKKFPDQAICVCWDYALAGVRKVVCSHYKANRTPKPKSFYRRLATLRRLVNVFWFSSDEPGREADDVMYALSRKVQGPHYIYTNDDDLLQAVDDRRGILVLKSWKSQLFEWDEQKVLEKYRVLPKMLPLYRAFVGDKSDNLFGVPRINKKYLAALVNWCDGQDFDVAMLAREIATGEGWKPDMKTAIHDFIGPAGDFTTNYALMKLSVFDVKIRDSTEDYDYACDKLVEWEMRSLKISQQFKDAFKATLENEEF